MTGPDHAAEVEVGELDLPVAVDQQVGGLEVPVEHWGAARVQVQQPLQPPPLITSGVLMDMLCYVVLCYVVFC